MISYLFPSAIASIAALATTSAVLLSCISCRRFFSRKKTKDLSDLNDGENGVILTKVEDDVQSKENGIKNNAYDKEKESNGEEGLPEQDVKVKNVFSENTEMGAVSSLTVENKCPDIKSDDNRPIGAETDKQQKDNETLIEDRNEDRSNTDRHTINTENKQDGKESETAITPLSRRSADLNHFSYSIKSNDVKDLSFAIEEIGTHETIVESLESPPQSVAQSEHGVIQSDWSRYEDVLIHGGWRRDVKLTDLLKMGLINETKADEVVETLSKSNNLVEDAIIPDFLKPYLEGGSPVAGILISESGEKRSIFRSAKDGILRRGTAISLLEAQAATGNIIDPITGRKMSVSDACQLGLIDKVYETVVSRAERAVTGFKTRVTNSTLSLGQAIERGLVIESHGIRLLEAQLATGGIIDHETNIKLPVELAVRRGLLDSQLANKLKAACSNAPDETKPDDLKTFFDPNTEEHMTYVELMRRSVVDDDTGMRLYPLEKIGRRRFSYASYSGRSSLASSRASSRESIPAAVAAST